MIAAALVVPVEADMSQPGQTQSPTGGEETQCKEEEKGGGDNPEREKRLDWVVVGRATHPDCSFPPFPLGE